MNKLSVIKLDDNHYGEYLSLAVDDIPLYKYFELCMDDDISDSVALPIKNPHDLKSLSLLWDHVFYWKGNGRFLWYLIDSTSNQVVPILSCPDDEDEMDCLLLAVYIRKDDNYVYWDRIGRIIHEDKEWDKMVQFGYKCGELLSKEKRNLYGEDTSIYAVDDIDAHDWIKDHWDEELFRRNMLYLMPRYKSGKAVKWLRKVNWMFPKEEYQALVECFRNSDVNLKTATIDRVTFIGNLLDVFPEKTTEYLEHISLYEDVLFHVLCNDIINVPLEMLLKENSDIMQIKKYCRFIENTWRNCDDFIKNVIDVTILEGLAQDENVWETFGTYITDKFKNYINNDLLT